MSSLTFQLVHYKNKKENLNETFEIYQHMETLFIIYNLNILEQYFKNSFLFIKYLFKKKDFLIPVTTGNAEKIIDTFLFTYILKFIQF